MVRSEGPLRDRRWLFKRESVESVLLDMHEGRNTVDWEEDRVYGAGSEIICGFEKTSKSALWR